MSYAVLQDLIDRFGDTELKEVADRDGDGTIDAAQVAMALGDASNLIDGEIRSRYALPLVSTPAVLTRLCADLARYFLHKDSPTEVIRNNYTDALKTLAGINAGRLELDVAGVEPDAPNSDDVQVSGPDRMFNRSTLEGY